MARQIDDNKYVVIAERLINGIALATNSLAGGRDRLLTTGCLVFLQTLDSLGGVIRLDQVLRHFLPPFIVDRVSQSPPTRCGLVP